MVVVVIRSTGSNRIVEVLVVVAVEVLVLVDSCSHTSNTRHTTVIVGTVMPKWALCQGRSKAERITFFNSGEG